MSWLSIFKKGDILTQGDRAELEALEGKTKELRAVLQKIDSEWVDSMRRGERLREVSEKLSRDPTNEKLYAQLTLTACMPTELMSGYQHIEYAKGPIGARIDEIMSPQHAICRRVLKRALDIAESELKRVEGKEKKTAEEEGYDFVPSGKVLALQARIMALRNEVATPIPGEEKFAHAPANWRTRLSEWL